MVQLQNKVTLLHDNVSLTYKLIIKIIYVIITLNKTPQNILQHEIMEHVIYLSYYTLSSFKIIMLLHKLRCLTLY